MSDGETVQGIEARLRTVLADAAASAFVEAGKGHLVCTDPDAGAAYRLADGSEQR